MQFNVLIVICCLLLTSCASIINGTHQKVTVVTDPPGATVSDGKNCWTTPAVIKLVRKNEQVLFICKKGYKMQSLRLKRIGSPAVLGNILMPGGFIGLGIDSLTGAQFKFVPDVLKIQLKSLKDQDVEYAEQILPHFLQEKLREFKGKLKTT